MKSQNDAWFQLISTADRTAAVLARRHGYKSVKDLANSLQPHANVLDVGAGASSLGSEIAKLRPDIHWTNLDYSYLDKQILHGASRDTPANVEFIAGDAAKLEESIKPESMDVVFSYWLFPHLSSYDKETALAAAAQLYKATKTGGLVVVGPCKPLLFRHPHPWGKSWRVIKSNDLTAEAYSHEILRRTNLSVGSHHIRHVLNIAASEVFTTSYYVKSSTMFTRKLYDPKSCEYISAYSPRAFYLVGKFMARAVARLVGLARVSKKANSQAA